MQARRKYPFAARGSHFALSTRKPTAQRICPPNGKKPAAQKNSEKGKSGSFVAKSIYCPVSAEKNACKNGCPNISDTR